ncbi:MAG TPA: lipase maturation factor family protein [Candidatus Binatia bacterium]|nr:lipase maturation factor family protein [Candidatus Binatia bacterium]
MGWLLSRGVALVYLVAFASLAVQIQGLYGSDGILPISSYLEWLRGRGGPEVWQSYPSLLWLGHGDAALAAFCWSGIFASLAWLAGFLPLAAASICWVLYLSLFVVGRVFLSFQWDILLLEAGFLAIFLQPTVIRESFSKPRERSDIVIVLFRWLLFRLMFASGAVKLLSDDPVWWNLTALEYHYWTQPLPTWTAWHAHHLPGWFHRICTGAMFAVELVVPFFVFGPRRPRLLAFAPLVLLQLAIAATGNYTFFNLLTLVLCVSVLDDAALPRWLRARPSADDVRGLWMSATEPASRSVRDSLASAFRVAGRGVAIVLALTLAACGGAQMMARLGQGTRIPWPIARMTEAVAPYHLTSSYGLFAMMTRQRPEIVLEGSRDGQQWTAYEFRWKPGDVTRAPAFVQPHQPRLDWQMWFAALGDYRRNLWLIELQRRLLEGSPPVIALLDRDPFAGDPPRHVRAMLYEYRFTDPQTRRSTGAWWTRQLLRQYSPTQSR